MGVLRCLGGMAGLVCSGRFGGMGFAAMRTCLVRMRKWAGVGSWGLLVGGLGVLGSLGSWVIEWKFNCSSRDNKVLD